MTRTETRDTEIQATPLPAVEVGDTIRWQAPQGLAEAEVRAAGLAWITTTRGMVAWDTPGLEIVRKRGDKLCQSCGVKPAERYCEDCEPDDAPAHTDPPATPEPRLWVRMVPLDDIRPFRFQTRREFRDEDLAELAESIRQRGVDQPVGIRRNPTAAEDGQPFELIYGERRYRASRSAGLAEIPVRDYGVLDDLQAYERHLDENEKRAQLNPLERAQAYQRLQELGMSQQEIGQRFGISQERVSRVIALGGLPERARALIGEGKLTAGHGVELLKWREKPAICTALAEQAATDGWSVSRLRDSLQDWSARQKLVDLKVVVDLGRAAFDHHTVCKECPHLVKANSYTFLCTSPAEFEARQKEARQQKKAEEKAAREKALNQSGGPASSAGYVKLQDLKQHTYLDLTQGWGYAPNYIVVPETCRAGTCSQECRGMAWDQKRKQAVPVCLDPKAAQAEGQRLVTEAQDRRRRDVDELLELAAAELADRGEVAGKDLALIGLPAVWSLNREELRVVADAAQLGLSDQELNELHGKLQGRGAEALAQLRRLPPLALLRFFVQATLRQSAWGHIRSENCRPWQLRWYTGR